MFFYILIVVVVGLFFWAIISFVMKDVGLEHLKMIDTDEAYDLIEKNAENPDFQIIDLRTHNEYYQEHLKDAILVSYTDDDFKEQLNTLDKNKTYLVYCWKGKKAKHVRSVMNKSGFQRAYLLSGGFKTWKDEGFPVEKYR